jgi:Lar family restriction alleviation protein
MKETELKPCPFCGGKAEVSFVSDKVPYVLKKYHNRYIFAGCRNCGIVTPVYNAFNNTGSPLRNEANTESAKRKAIKAWNRRADNEQREAEW